METINKIGELIPKVVLSQPESNPSPSVKYHIKGEPIEWKETETERFWKIKLIESMQEEEPFFVVDDRNKVLLSSLYNWVWNKEGLFDPCKGLLFWGPIGVGKSALLKGLQRYYGKINQYCYGFSKNNIGFKLTSAAEIALLYAEKGMSGIAQYTDRNCMCHLAIDELGREPLDAKHYGTEISVVQVILQLRYEVRREFITLATTNLNPDTEFERTYGDYIADRVKELFNVIEIKGKSRR